MRQFASHPITEYTLNGSTFLATNFFIHFTLREVLKDNPNFLQSYDLSADERPDIVAEKVYGDSDLAWLVLMTNDIVDPNEEWVKNTSNFLQFLNAKYDTAKEMYGVAYNVRNGSVADYDAMGILNDNKSPFGTTLSSKDSGATDITQYSSVSVAYSEQMQNENRRTIKVIKKEFVDKVLSEINTKIKNTGS